MKANSAKIDRLLRTARGQIDGILKMVEEDQYCLDIVNQVLAAEAILRRVDREIVRAHMESCVGEALRSADPREADRKIEELCGLLEKLAK